MKNLLRLQEKGEKRNTQNSLLKRVGKKIAAVCLAFGAQYGGVLDTPQAFAQTQEQTQTVREETVLRDIDQDIVLADGAYTLKSGLVFMNGTAILAYPVQDATTGKRYIMAHEDPGITGDYVIEQIQKLASLMGEKGVKDIYPDSRQFMEFTQEQLDGIQMTDDEKRRLFFSRAFFWSYMGHWESTGEEKENVKATSVDIKEASEGFQAAVDSFQKLDDQSPWFQERLKDIEVLRAVLYSSSFSGASGNRNFRKRTIDQRLHDTGYEHLVLRATEIMQARTVAFLEGEMPKSEFLVAFKIFCELANNHGRFMQGFRERGWMDRELLDMAMLTMSRILPVYQAALSAFGQSGQVQNRQEAREKVLQAPTLLAYQELLATFAYAYPEITPEQMDTWATQNKEIASILIDKYGAETLFVPETLVSSLDERFAAFQTSLPRYTRLANAAQTGVRLTSLFAKVRDSQAGKWLDSDKSDLQEIYQNVINSPTNHAEKQFLAVLQDGIRVSEPTVDIKRFEETGLTQNYKLSPIIREINGQSIVTTEHPVDTVKASFSVENTLPIPLNVTFEITLNSAADNPRDVRSVRLPANQIADITYMGHVPLESSRAGGSRTTPIARLELAMNGFQEVASSTWGEQKIASAK
ncbi:hypothetical protein COW36_03435 [bacterium (Candidatus Blackallbacteria) CG17_big_fil_post_rev_8_21_14_2_50_48_46]|uniref:DUF3160 domain-containing protein n=1 Tax=bacterium (Candidatus Blackallbacteria) CG17_big_fil_post_rev_8_21_14_2_50_48_46 TaxID=2014261 RepID=A0A2M7GA50_9BACT|nr:MAG: hypothetical protein COW64_25855 [bacterium (Candidatus Blackallbacteria) CG18_big_fil_WC_8_21_14_2_50_49_26]PIW18763.1 MAG: hypothetical protein COW36_03435 [bacterium (Candidatus Blackallbacteria) CG17_big_fil_post_rev_8_21_14_2_50_48_46]PIW49450.1 MAG: hypothetical protein COW20_05800 [bacterium (Candidatus Blackallbacteria) CG13_big_fil_rev_8_21_14_2_50_49_14]